MDSQSDMPNRTRHPVIVVVVMVRVVVAIAAHAHRPASVAMRRSVRAWQDRADAWDMISVITGVSGAVK